MLRNSEIISIHSDTNYIDVRFKGHGERSVTLKEYFGSEELFGTGEKK